MKNMLDGGEAIVEALRALKVDYVFSSPGSDWGALWEAFARQKVNGTPGPEYVSCGHETLAVNLAMGHTFMTGRMQAVVLHTGVGLLQGSLGIDAARKLGLPMIIFSSEALTYGEKEGFDPGQQWISTLNNVGGPQRLVEPIVKWSSPAISIDNLYEMIVRAGELAQQNPTGPVYINVPIETTLQQWTPPKTPRKVVRPALPQAPASEIERVAKLLLSAELPVIVTEGAGRQAEGYKALLELAELLSIPVFEPFPTEVANFPKDHPLHQGPTIQPVADQTDLVLVVRSRVPWYPARNKPPRATIVVLDETPVRDSMVYQNIPADITLEGDVVHSLKMLAAAAKAGKPDTAKVKARREKCEAVHAKRLESDRRHDGEAAAKPTINSVWLCHVLNEMLPKDTVFVDETITYRGSTIRHLFDRGPQSFFRVGGGLGQGLGTALGVKNAAPEKTVTWIVGDGAFLYNPLPQSLAFAKHRGAPILILVLNNTGYDSMAKEHRAWYPNGVSAEHDIFYGRQITDFDYAELAKPFGGFGRRVDKPADVKPAIEEALAALKSGKTAILNFMVDRTEAAR